MEFSIVIIVKNRMKQLVNVLEGIERSTIYPKDVQIVAMDDAEYAFKHTYPFTIEAHHLRSNETLPLAAARNMGAHRAQTDTLVFIDVDCIVEPTLFEDFLKQLHGKTILTAYPLYLPSLPDHGNYLHLKADAVPHPSRGTLPAFQPVEHTKFWSLIFALSKDSYQAIGGFDESFTGYGGEDTDFAQSFHKAGYTLLFTENYVLHQYHDKYDPPLNYFEAIIKNARRYKEKWGTFAMFSWLKKFESLGLISLTQEEITVLRHPTTAETEAQRSTEPY